LPKRTPAGRHLLFVLFITATFALRSRGMTAQPAAGPDVSALERFDCPASRGPVDTSAAVCGWLTVPEDHAHPENGRTVQVAVAVVPATGPGRRGDPIVYLQGGPGGPAVESFGGWAALLRPLLAERDLVVIDQRGVGLSRPRLDCPEVVPYALGALARGASDDEYIDGYFDTLGGCIERLREAGVNLAAYTSAQSAADTAAALRALGYREANLFGISYGARQVLTVARDFGVSGLVRSAIIGGVYGPEANALEIPLNFVEAAGKLFEDCALQPACNAAYPDLRARWDLYVDGLNRQPVTVELGMGQMSARIPADASVAYAALFSALVGSEGVVQLPRLLDAAFKGDTSFLRRGVFAVIGELGGMDWGLNTAVQCGEEFPLVTAAESSAVAAQTPPAMHGFALRFPESTPRLLPFCSSLGLPAPDPRENEPVRSDVPFLVINGNLDPFTPPSWGARSTALMRTRYLYVLGSAGHDSALANDCALALGAAFVADPGRAPDMSCLAAYSAPAFALPAAPVSP
jgi:pimeloyl-ACP methyl ester carboxylesterase